MKRFLEALEYIFVPAKVTGWVAGRLTFGKIIRCSPKESTMKTTVKGLVEEANTKVKAYEVGEAIEMLNDKSIQFVDVREDHEVHGEGIIPGAVHASRGMLEFYLDAESPYYRKDLDTGRSLIFYCKSGGRSALATQRAIEMGFANVAHIAGGLNAWKAHGGPLERAKNPNAAVVS